MKKFSKAVSALMASVMAASMLAGCTDAASTETPDTQAQAQGTESSANGGATFKIGAIGPLTGAAAVYGNAVCNAAELAVEEINEAGGINGYQVEYSKEDNCLFGKVQGMSKDLIVFEGQTLDELRKDFEDGIDSYLEGCKADGVEPAKPYSGRLNLRMSSELHSRVAAFVAATGTTINDFINRAIRDELKKVAVL